MIRSTSYCEAMTAIERNAGIVVGVAADREAKPEGSPE